MPINSMESIFCVALFVVPGYITSVVKKRLCPTANVSDGVRVIRSITLSLSNFLLWFWLYGLILADCAPWEDVKAFLSFRGLLFILVLFGTSAANGFLFAIVPGLLKGLKSLKLIKWIKSLKLIRWQTPYVTAWDYMFHEFAMTDGLGLEITLENGKCIKGVFTKGSQAAFDADGKFVDILFKEVYYDKKDCNDGEPQEVYYDKKDCNDGKPQFGNSIWISRDEIKSLKLTPVPSGKGCEKI